MLWSAVPRGLRGFVVNLGVLDAKPVSDQQLLTLTATLPSSFGYVLSEIHLSIAQDEAGNWNDGYTLNLQNWYQGQLAMPCTWNLPWTDGLVTPASGPPAVEKNSSAITVMDSLPKGPMWSPRGTSGILISIQAQNQDGDVAAVGQVNAYITFWEFDLEQIRKYPINSPLPTHSR